MQAKTFEIDAVRESRVYILLFGHFWRAKSWSKSCQMLGSSQRPDGSSQEKEPEVEFVNQPGSVCRSPVA